MRISLIVVGIIMTVVAYSQNSNIPTIGLSQLQTTSVIMPGAIRHVDLGHRQVVAMVAPRTKNILFLKAGTSGFTPTNVTIVTDDGAIFMIRVIFDSLPGELVYHLPVAPTLGHENIVPHSEEPTSVSIPVRICSQIAASNARGTVHKKTRAGVSLRLKKIYVLDDQFYFNLELTNHSQIDFLLDHWTFFYKDAKRYKRTAIQERVLHPSYCWQPNARVIAGCRTTIIIVTPRFHLPVGNYLQVRVQEPANGRSVAIPVFPSDIRRIKPFYQNREE